MKKLITLDVGTTAVKASVFSEDLNLLASDVREYTLEAPGPGLLELNPDVYWENAVKGIRSIIEQTGTLPEEIAAITCTTQGETLIPVDKEGEALHNAVIWKDEACEWASVGLNHLCLICGDGDETEKMLREKNGIVFESIEDEPDWKCLFFRGPNQERIEIMEIRSDMFPVVYTIPNESPYIRGMGHVGIFSGDYEKSIQFYCGVMGFEHLITFEEGGFDQPFWNKNAVLRCGDAVIELLCPLQHALIREKYYYQARMQMTLFGMKPEGTVQDAVKMLRESSEIEWIQQEVAFLPDLPPGNNIEWASFRDPNGFLWEIVKDFKKQK